MDAFALDWHRHNAPECECDEDGKRLAIHVKMYCPNGTPEEKLAVILKESRNRYGA